MLNSTKKAIKSRKITALVQALLCAVALIVYVIFQFAIGKDNLGFSPIWMIFIVYFLGSAGFYLTAGILVKSAVSLIYGGISCVLGTEILLFCLIGGKYWYAFLLIGVLILAIVFALTFYLKSDKLVVEFDNAPDSERKTYAERTDEVKEESSQKEETSLPEIKSFKD